MNVKLRQTLVSY